MLFHLVFVFLQSILAPFIIIGTFGESDRVHGYRVMIGESFGSWTFYPYNNVTNGIEFKFCDNDNGDIKLLWYGPKNRLINEVTGCQGSVDIIESGWYMLVIDNGLRDNQPDCGNDAICEYEISIVNIKTSDGEIINMIWRDSWISRNFVFIGLMFMLSVMIMVLVINICNCYKAREKTYKLTPQIEVFDGFKKGADIDEDGQ